MPPSASDIELINRYENGGHQLRLAVRGLTPEDFRATPIAGKWSTHQVVIHLADAETALADRARRVIAMDEPPLLAWDENKFIQALHYDDQSAEDALLIIEATRRQLARVLRNLPAAAFDRFGIHNEAGKLTLRDIIGKANGHLAHHQKFIAEKLEALGKLMW
jgi:hypothetical protein